MRHEPSEARPIVSHVGDDGTLAELLYDPATATTALAVRDGDGSVRVASSLTASSGERLIPYSAKNTLIETGCVLLPSAVGDAVDKEEVLAAVRAHLRRYVDLSPLFEEIAAHYVLLTWVYDAFNELPYLRFRGDYGTGKTRALLTVGSLCYKPFFASGASTVSPIFHILDAFGGTLVLDEADFRFSAATAELTKILNNGNVKGLPVLRTMTNRHRELNPQAFRIYGPKVIAMRGRFVDPALESRFLTEDTRVRALRPAVPIHAPDAMRSEAQELRNRLLAWRLHHRNDVGPDPARAPNTLSPRARQIGLALLSIVDDASVRDAICAQLAADESALRPSAHVSAESAMVAAILDALDDSPSPASVAAVTDRFNARMAATFGTSVTNQWVGSFLRKRLMLTTVKSHGVYVIPIEERARITALAAAHAIPTEEGSPGATNAVSPKEREGEII